MRGLKTVLIYSLSLRQTPYPIGVIPLASAAKRHDGQFEEAV
jgi:hypothetical protein